MRFTVIASRVAPVLAGVGLALAGCNSRGTRNEPMQVADLDGNFLRVGSAIDD